MSDWVEDLYYSILTEAIDEYNYALECECDYCKGIAMRDSTKYRNIMMENPEYWLFEAEKEDKDELWISLSDICEALGKDISWIRLKVKNEAMQKYHCWHLKNIPMLQIKKGNQPHGK